jgi:hypothetical protein
MHELAQEIQKESEELIKQIVEYVDNHKNEIDFLDNIYDFYEWKLEELFEHIEKHRDNGISTFQVIGILKLLFTTLGEIEALNDETITFIDAVCPSIVNQMIQKIGNDEYRYFEEQTGTSFYKLHSEEPDDAPHREYPFDVLSGRTLKK